MNADHLVIYATIAVVGITAWALVTNGSPYLAVFIVAMLLASLKVNA